MNERLTALLRLAVRYSASDIHFTLKGSDLTIELRVASTLLKVRNAPGDVKLLRYLQYRANLDVGNALLPQTGSFEVELDGAVLSLRFALISTLSYSNAVLRIQNSKLDIKADSLSGLKEQNVFFHRLLKKDCGLVLFSGPTGSGKTTSLYTLLDSIAAKNKVYTIEDPIEVYNEALVQLQVNMAAGFDYGEGIAQILRHDPDVIMIGEIRDARAARMAVIAANTGHLVLATIHCGKASGCISRMVELGVNEDHLYEVLLALVNQRMVEDSRGQRKVLYEIMDEKEIAYFRQHQRNSEDFDSLSRQYERGVAAGEIKAE